MGVGAWLSQFIDKELGKKFVDIEIGVALLGGFSAPLLFLSFARLSYFLLVLYSVVFFVGVLVGLEIPLLMRILKDHLDFKEIVSKVLTFDYIGALVASLLFPLFLVPKLGLVRTSLVFGILNALVGLWASWLLQPVIKSSVAGLRARAVIVITLLLAGAIKADFLTTLAEDELFADTIVYSKTTQYQRIIITRNRAGFQLFLNGHLQFSSTDEYRYHESLVHPAMMVAREPRRVLVMGGGDGLAVREILRHPSVESVTLVDLDPDMTKLSERFPSLSELNSHAFSDPRVTVVNRDAFTWIEDQVEPFDVAIIDFPDPNSYALGKLYTRHFYQMLRQRLTPDAAIAVQSTSPLFARKSYWCIMKTLESAGFYVKPYQVAVPSFGVWGFALAALKPFDVPSKAPEGLRFLDHDSMEAMFILPADLGPLEVEVNRLDNQSLVNYYESEWKRYE